MNEPQGPCAVYVRGIAYSDEVFYVDPDPILDAALRNWRSTGDAAEVLSLLQHQDEFSESPDTAASVQGSYAEAAAAMGPTLLETIRGITFIDFGFDTLGIGSGQSMRWYSTEDDDNEWLALEDAGDASSGPRPDDVSRLKRWCDTHGWPHPKSDDRRKLELIAERAMDTFPASLVDQQPRAFLADTLADQLMAAGRDDLLVDLWRTFVPALVYVGPAPTGVRVPFDLRTLSFFREKGIDTSAFSATTLASTNDGPSTPASPSRTPLPPTGAGGEPRKGLFGRLFGR